MLIPLLLALLQPTPAPLARSTPDGSAWAPVAAYDEVRIEADTARIDGAGPYTVWVRWSFLQRASSPGAWDQGVRTTVDLVEVDCAAGATRTFSSLAYRGDGAAIAQASFEEPAAPWRVARPGTMGAELADGICELMRRR